MTQNADYVAVDYFGDMHRFSNATDAYRFYRDNAKSTVYFIDDNGSWVRWL